MVGTSVAENKRELRPAGNRIESIHIARQTAGVGAKMLRRSGKNEFCKHVCCIARFGIWRSRFGMSSCVCGHFAQPAGGPDCAVQNCGYCADCSLRNVANFRAVGVYRRAKLEGFTFVLVRIDQPWMTERLCGASFHGALEWSSLWGVKQRGMAATNR
jgi:hypothetical protein